MASYVATVRFTAQGCKGIRDTTKRAAGIKAAAKKMGVEVSEIYWTIGAFDGVLIFQAPDDETATALMLHVCSQGYVQTRTMRAFTAREMDRILKMRGRGR